MKVLIVEDEEVSRLFLAQLVQGQGHRVLAAENGEEGFAAFQSFHPDLVFTDIAMPVMDGLEMLADIRRENTDAIVIITTAFGTQEFTLKALRLSANDYLLKPLNQNEIFGVLKKYENVISNRSVEREILGMVFHQEFSMKIGNHTSLLGKIVDRLMIATERLISSQSRLGTRLGLVEILLNAIEHGNLQISYEEKTRALEIGFEEWERLLSERKRQPSFKDRRVTIRFFMNREFCQWTITDEGSGFDWKNIPNPLEPAHLSSLHGRGILLAKLNFDEVTFSGNGNTVLLKKHLSPPEDANLSD